MSREAKGISAVWDCFRSHGGSLGNHGVWVWVQRLVGIALLQGGVLPTVLAFCHSGIVEASLWSGLTRTKLVLSGTGQLEQGAYPMARS